MEKRPIMTREGWMGGEGVSAKANIYVFKKRGVRVRQKIVSPSRCSEMKPPSENGHYEISFLQFYREYTWTASMHQYGRRNLGA